MELPALFLKRMELLTGGSFAAQYEAPQARGLRINTLKASADGLRHCLPLSAEPVPFCRDGYAVPETFRAGSDPLHHAGAYYMQEPSAMSAVTLLAPQPGERVPGAGPLRRSGRKVHADCGSTRRRGAPVVP